MIILSHSIYENLQKSKSSWKQYFMQHSSFDFIKVWVVLSSTKRVKTARYGAKEIER